LAAKRGTPNNSAYCAAKFGMTGLTQALAKELGTKGIRVNALCPVLVRTPGLIEALSNPTSPAKGDPEGFLAAFASSQSALGRLPTGAEVAAMALYLASPAASAISGQSINVDCGVLPQ
jgi:3-oxoacyl-[acyl-carrier protein] reductase/meso-butanediol dehydrogenase/(S,S)-butanediol dehydrogenase/diacetyl reductase